MQNIKNVKERKRRRAIISAACLAIPVITGLARADENGTWASAVSGNWSDSTKWSNGSIAGGATGQTADFSQTGTNTPLTINLDVASSIGTMLFNASTVGGVGSWTVSSTNGSVLTLAGPAGAVIQNESAPKSVSVTIGVNLAGTLSSGSLELYSGTGSATPSSIYLTGTNTFTGEVDVEQGLVGITSASALGSSSNDIFLDENTSVSGNALEFLSQGINLSNPINLGRRTPINVDLNDVTFSGAINGSTTGSFSVIGGNYVAGTSEGSLYLNPTSNTSKASWTIASDTTLIAGNTVGSLGLDNALGTGTTNVSSGGTLAFKNTTGNPLTYSSASITINNSGAAANSAPVGAIENLAGINTFAGTVSLAGGTGNQNGVGITAGSLTLSGAIIGGSSNVLLKLGTGPLYLAGTNTFTGGTIVQNGTLVAGISNAGSTSGAFGPTNGTTGSVSLGGAGSLTNGSLSVSVLTGGSFTVANPITATAGGTGALSIGGNADTNSTFSGLITLNNNLTVSQVSNAGTNALSITGGIKGGNSGAQTVTFAGPGNIDVNTGTIADSGANTLTVSATGGVTTFGISNAYSGGTTVSAGILADSAGGVAGAFGSGNVTVTPTGTLSTQSAELIANDNSSISPTAAITVNDNTSANGTVVFSGAAPTIATLSGTGNVVLNGAAGTALTTGTTGNPTFWGVISDNGTLINSGSLTVTGSGTFTMAGTSTYFGSTNVSGGTLNITGALANSTAVNVNNSSNLVLAGASALPSAAIVNVSANANVLVNAGQTIAAISSAGNATFSAGNSIVGTGSGVGIGAGGGATTGGISGSGTLTVTGIANLTAASITQRVLNIGATSTVTIADSAAPGNASSVSVLTDINNNGTLDLNNNDLIVTDSTQYTTIKALINNAADSGAWDQPGITSSSARTNSSSYGLGYAPASALTTSTFDGVALAGTETVVKYTLLGDTQLRGTVGLGDYNAVLTNYGVGTDWYQGDFHNSGVVGLGDYNAVLTNYGVTASGNLVTGPALTRGLSPSLSLSPSLAKTDMKLEVNTSTGDVYLQATTAVAFTGYTISDPSSHLLGGSTTPDPAKLLSVSPANGGNTSPYETGSTYVNWVKISETGLQMSEAQNNNGFATHSSRDDTLSIPASGTIDFGDIYNTAVNNQDISFDFSEAGSTPTSGPTYYGAEVDYVGGSQTPEPGILGTLGLGGLMLMRRRRKGGAEA